MERHYHLHAAARKPLIAALEKITGTKPCYTGPRQFAYIFGELTLDNEGILSSENESELLRISHQLVAESFRAEEGQEYGLTISLPREDLSDLALSRLMALIDSKASILKRALGAATTEMTLTDKTISFPWFETVPTAEEISAYTTFFTLLMKHAKEAKRITGKDHAVENEKYYFRCFLLRLGLIGAEYKDARRILLQHLEGSSAFRFLPNTKEEVHA